MPWVSHETVREIQNGADPIELDSANEIYCMSEDRKYFVLIRNHKAWFVPGNKGGWRDMNGEAGPNHTSRQILNFFSTPSEGNPGIWSKIFLPLSFQVISIKSLDNSYYEINSNTDKKKIKFPKFEELLWEFMTGNAESEEEIERKFALLCS